MIYYYFDNKEDLFRAAIERAVNQSFDQFARLRAEHQDPIAVIDAWLGTHIELFTTIRRMVKVALDYKSSSLTLPSVDASIARFYDLERDALVTCIERGQATGLFDASASARSITETISTFLDGIMVRSYIVDDFDPLVALNEFRLVLWSMLGLQQPKSRLG